MKIQLDYDLKEIRLEKDINLGEFVEKIQEILPDFKDWKLSTNNIINWTNPIIIDRYPSPIQPYDGGPQTPQPWWEWPQITCESGNINASVCINDTNTSVEFEAREPNSGTFCIEINA